MGTGQAAVSTENTLRKVGAHLRWLLEKSGIDPTTCHILIGVDNVADRTRVLQTFAREFDAKAMARCAQAPLTVWVHGVAVSVAQTEKPPREAA